MLLEIGGTRVQRELEDYLSRLHEWPLASGQLMVDYSHRSSVQYVWALR